MWEKVKKSFLINAIFLALAVITGYGAVNILRQAVFFHNEAKGIEAKIKTLSEKKQKLEEYAAELQTKEAIEREAKARLNVKKKGETVVVVTPEEKKGLASEGEGTLWTRFVNLFKRIFR